MLGCGPANSGGIPYDAVRGARITRVQKTCYRSGVFFFMDKRGTTQYQGFGTLVIELNAKLEDLKKNKLAFGKLELGDWDS